MSGTIRELESTGSRSEPGVGMTAPESCNTCLDNQQKEFGEF